MYSNNVLLHQILFSSLPVAGFQIPRIETAAAAVVVTVTAVATVIADVTVAAVSPCTIKQRPYCLFSRINATGSCKKAH